MKAKAMRAQPRAPVERAARRAALSGALVGSLVGALALLGQGPYARAAEPKASGAKAWTRLRRVVTSNDANGKGVVLFDGEPGNAFVLNGTRIVRLWETPSVPARLPFTADAGATAGNAYREGFRGTSFYIAEIPGGKNAPNIPLHSNRTIDYMAIISGKIAFKLEDRELVLRPGDTIVQGGNMHSWVNRWREPCLLLFVVLTTEA